MDNVPVLGDIEGESRAVSETVGYALIFAMILGGTTVIVVFGAPALADAQGQAEMERGEHLMTLFDSRAAMVALGESGTQSVSFGQGGSFATKSNVGYLAIKHVEYEAGSSEEVFNESLGAVVYENRGTELAYQGGGVWRLDGQGDARMVSPPEFHYRGATLTLPVIRVDGNSSASGSVNAQLTASTQARTVYPNAATTYPGTSRQYANPIENGTVHVFVRSPYYRGWAEYFRERTSGNVTVFDSNQTVRLELMSLEGDPGAFPMPLEGDSLTVSAFGDGHPIEDYSITLTADSNGNGNGNGRQFTNGHWSLYSTEGGDEFEIHINLQQPAKCNGDDMPNDVGLSVYYYNSSTGVSHEWQNDSIDPNDPATAVDVDCTNKQVTVDFTSVETNLTYGDMTVTGSNNKWAFGSQIKSRDAPDSLLLDDHPEDGSTTFEESDSDDATTKFVINHYMSQMGVNYDLTVKDGPGGSSRIDEANSYGTLRYEEAAGGQYITYLHVTENELNVSFR